MIRNIHRKVCREISQFTTKDMTHILMFLGLCLGIYLGTEASLFQFDQKLFCEEFLFSYKGENIDNVDFFYAVLEIRLLQFIMLLLLRNRKKGQRGLAVLFTVVLFGMGILLANMILIFQMKGLFMFLMLFLPQGVFYVPTVMFLTEEPKRIFENPSNYDIIKNRTSTRRVKRENVWLVLQIVVTFFAGVMAESFWNPMITEWILG